MWLLIRYSDGVVAWHSYRLPIDTETVKRKMRDSGQPVIAVARRKVREPANYDSEGMDT